ncbi:MAG: IS1182 family transposase [Gelidibacter sp.]
MTSRTPTFIPYDQSQLSLLPPSLEDFVAKDHPARILNEIIEKIDITSLNEAYKSKGRASYHPKMLLKVLVYAYITNIYSSRKIEVACKENIHFMWLSGMSFPDHNTINRFRSERLAKHLRTVFDKIVLLLAEEGFLSIEEAYIDGTKIEANANKYTFVWKKSIVYYKEKMVDQLTTIWKYAQSIAKEEDELPPPPEFKVINKESVQQAIDTLNEVLKDNPEASKDIKLKLKYANDNYPKKIEEYLEKEDIFGDRNSYSKTDNDATFMRLKEDHMLNGQLKPAYNVQISSNNQFILSYTIHPNPTDTTTLTSHLAQHRASFGIMPSQVIADAGYGSEENYEFLESQNITAYVKFNTFDKEQRKKKNDKDFTIDSLHYNSEKDCFICPMGQEMNYIGNIQRKTTNGYLQTLKRYRAKNCKGCPLNGICHKSKQNRTIEINTNLNTHRRKATELLNSQEGIKKRKKRCHDVETVFGNIKHNHSFRRFMLRGRDKVEIEWGLLAIAQNIRKRAS